MSSQGEALVPGVQVVRLSRPVRVEIDAGGVPAADPAVEAEWERKRGLNPRLFDGPVLSVMGIDAAAGVVRCGLDSYKRLVVQPAVETGVRQLSVTGVVMATDAAGRRHVLLGRRSHRTRMYGGMWQNCPAGGIDPEAGALRLEQEGIVAELVREVKEEAGLEVRHIGTPVAVIYDEIARSHDLIVPVEVGEVPATARGWEYDELRWVETGRLAEFEAVEGERIMAITRAVFRVMGWIPEPAQSTSLYNRGLWAVVNGNEEEGLSFLYSSFAAHPHGATARRIAEALESRGDVEAADKWIGRAYEAQPASDIIAVKYAKALLRGNERDRARMVLREVLKRNATYGPARSLLAAIAF